MQFLDISSILILCSTVGASLLVYQIFAYRWIDKILGPINSTRISSVSYQSPLLFDILQCLHSSTLMFPYYFFSKLFIILINWPISIAGTIYTNNCCLSLHDTLVRNKTWRTSIHRSNAQKRFCSKYFTMIKLWDSTHKTHHQPLNG